MRLYTVRPAALSAAVSAALLVAAALPSHAEDRVKFEWDLRVRHERVEDDAFAKTADATTARLRAGLRFDLGSGWNALLEGEGVVNASDRYNSGANGETTYPAVADPESAEINQAWIGWKNDLFSVTAGRQRINLDNQRWVGAVGWRQNEQTFDALSMELKPDEHWDLRYSWLDRVHRVASDRARDPLARERNLSTHLFNASYKRGKQQLTGYAYIHEDQTVMSASTATYGLRWTGSIERQPLTWGWTAEIARQTEFADNPLLFRHNYWLLEPSLQAKGITWKLGWEHLGGDGHHALQTPLATLHAFDGWADKFLVTPAGGLEDRYVSAGGKAGKFTWAAAWHDYDADTRMSFGTQYGRELDLSLGRPLWKGWNALVKVADYRSDGFARDTRKVWLQLQWTH